MNSLIKNADNFGNIPVITKNGSPIYIKDVARVADAADITVDYALINGKRSVYIPVVKTADASTWTVVQNLKSKLPEMQALLPDDVKISYAFDQSVFVVNSVKSLMTEGGLGLRRKSKAKLFSNITLQLKMVKQISFCNANESRYTQREHIDFSCLSHIPLVIFVSQIHSRIIHGE